MNAAELIDKIMDLCKGKDPSKVYVTIEVDSDFTEYEDVADVSIVTSPDNIHTIVIKY